VVSDKSITRQVFLNNHNRVVWGEVSQLSQMSQSPAFRF
jgi:hypothetical protein